MSAGNLIFLFLIVGGFIAMFSMHRGGGHAHGGMGGCGGHGSHNRSGGDETGTNAHTGHEGHEQKPLLGPPGTAANESATAPAAHDERHRGC